jgi:regulator of protease activity HflC (stomatin/prohibitin superfamily)
MGLLKALSWLLLLYGIAGLIITFVKTDKLPYWKVMLPVGFTMIVLTSLIVVIGPQDVGVLTAPGGVRSVPIHTGWHVVAPWVDVHNMDKTVWVYTCANAETEGSKPNADAIWAPTKDGIKMGFDVSVSWRIIADEAPWVYQNVTENDGGNTGRYLWLEENVIRPKLKSGMALTVSNYTPIEAYSTKRQEIQNEVLQHISDECKKYKLIIDNVDVREVYYNPEYEKSINDKKLAEQEALRLIEVTKQREELKKQEAINKDIAILKAEGESKALQIKGNSISANPKIIDLEWINKWDGKLPTYMMGSGQGVIMSLPSK